VRLPGLPVEAPPVSRSYLFALIHRSQLQPDEARACPLPTSKRGPRSCVSRASVTTLRQLILRTSPWVEHRSGVAGHDSHTIGFRSPVFPSSPAAWAASRPCEAQQSAPPSAPAGPELTIGPVITWMVAANPRRRLPWSRSWRVLGDSAARDNPANSLMPQDRGCSPYPHWARAHETGNRPRMGPDAGQ